MKKIILFTICLLLTHLTIAKEVLGKSYKFDVPEYVEFESKSKSDVYTFKWGNKSSKSTMEVIQYIEHGDPQVINSMLSNMVMAMESLFDKTNLYEIVSKSRHEIKFGKYAGQEFRFELKLKDKSKLYSTTLFIFDGINVWSVSLVSPKLEDTDFAKNILLTMTKK